MKNLIARTGALVTPTLLLIYIMKNVWDVIVLFRLLNTLYIFIIILLVLYNVIHHRKIFTNCTVLIQYTISNYILLVPLYILYLQL